LTEKKKTFVTFVLDETGSMEPIKDDTIGGFNRYVSGLKSSGEEFLFTLIKFDSNKHDVVHRAVPVGEVSELTAQTYRPGAMTPLIDACCKAIKATEEKVAGEDVNVAIVIQTDGYENASTEFKNTDLARLIKEKTAQGWLFTFLGAGIDAFRQAREFGIAAANVMTYDRDKSAGAFTASLRGTLSYAATGQALDASYTSQERAQTGGHMPPASSAAPQAQAQTTAEPDKEESLVEDISI
jgi:hypothetical protein